MIVIKQSMPKDERWAIKIPSWFQDKINDIGKIYTFSDPTQPKPSTWTRL